MSIQPVDVPGAAADAGPQLNVSVVVASRDGAVAAERCLVALEKQRGDGIGQIILVDNSEDATPGYIRDRFPAVEVVERPGFWLVPQLWGIGAALAEGDVVAFLTTQVIPGDTWVRGHLEVHRTGAWSAVGGSFEPSSRLRPVDWGVYWLRFARWGGPSYRGEVADVAGDNASYRRELIAPHLVWILRHGFWESELHEEFRRTGGRFVASPEAAVRFVGGSPFSSAARHRWEHGRRFGAHRVARSGMLIRVGRIVTWPATPFVFLGRLCAHARDRGEWSRFVRSLPVLAGLVAAWSIGEFCGYLAGHQTESATPKQLVVGS